MMVRRGADIAVAIVGGLFAFPLCVLLAIAVAMSMGRPILFIQPRSGAHGIPFALIKFRTMRELYGPDGVLLDDTVRTTRLGRFLRRSRLDELPSLWNILVGDMTLIGPRPLLPVTVAAFGAGGVARGAVRPGLTGWAQINGNSLLQDGDKLALDLWYIRHASFALDLQILVRTIAMVLLGEKVNRRWMGRAYANGPDRRG